MMSLEKWRQKFEVQRESESERVERARVEGTSEKRMGWVSKWLNERRGRPGRKEGEEFAEKFVWVHFVLGGIRKPISFFRISLSARNGRRNRIKGENRIKGKRMKEEIITTWLSLNNSEESEEGEKWMGSKAEIELSPFISISFHSVFLYRNKTCTLSGNQVCLERFYIVIEIDCCGGNEPIHWWIVLDFKPKKTALIRWLSTSAPEITSESMTRDESSLSLSLSCSDTFLILCIFNETDFLMWKAVNSLDFSSCRFLIATSSKLKIHQAKIPVEPRKRERKREREGEEIH